VILVKGDSDNVIFTGVEKALEQSDTQIRLFGKPEVKGERRMGVCLARGADIEEARQKANRAAQSVQYSL
jgi:phosphoribosylglycinamide formyltransferase 2